MNICLLSARFPPQRCGVGDHTYFLGTALTRMGHSVDVLTSTGELDLASYPLDSNMRVHRIVERWDGRALRTVLAYLRRARPELLLIQYAPHAFNRRGITFAVNALPLLARIGTRTRVVTNFHEMYIPFGLSLARFLGAFWQRAMALTIAYGSHALIATTAEWSRRLRGIGVLKRVEVVPVGSNIPQAHTSGEDRARIRHQVLGSEGGLLVCCFGALHDRNVDAALHAVARLERSRHARLFWIGGNEADGRSGAQLQGAGISLTGHLPPRDVSHLLAACDVVCLPFIDGISTRRTSAVTVLEHGLPLLTTRSERSDECFVHGRNVYLVPAGDRDALADGLLELARDPELRARLAQGGSTLYQTHFAWDVVAPRVLRAMMPNEAR